MLVRWIFEYQKKKFLSRKKYFLDVAKDELKIGNSARASEIEVAVNKLQEESDKLTMHFLSGGSCFSKIFRVWGFWQDLSNLEDSFKSIFRQIFETIFFVGGTVFLMKRFWFNMYVVPSGSAEPNLLVGDRIVGVKYPYLFKAPKRGDLVIFDQPKFKYSSNVILKNYQRYIGVPFLGILPAGPDSWVKRLVGLPGDRVELKINEKQAPEVWVNGELLHEPSLNPWPVIHLTRKRGFIPATSRLMKLPIISSFIELFGLNEDFSSMSMLYTFDPSRPYDDQPFYNFSKEEISLNPYTQKPIIRYPQQADRNDRIPEFVVPKGKYFFLGDNRKNSGDGRIWGVISEDLILGRASFIFWSLDGVESWWIVEFLKDPIKFFTKKIRYHRIFRSVHPFKEIPKN